MYIGDRTKKRRIISKSQADLLWQLHNDQPRLVSQLTWASRKSEPSKYVTHSRWWALRALERWGFVRLWLAPSVSPKRRRKALWVAITARGRDWLYLWPTAPGPSEAVRRADEAVKRASRREYRRELRESRAAMAGRT